MSSFLKVVIGLVFSMVILNGCVYGGQIKDQNAPSSSEYVVVVQNAVEQYLLQ